MTKKIQIGYYSIKEKRTIFSRYLTKRRKLIRLLKENELPWRDITIRFYEGPGCSVGEYSKLELIDNTKEEEIELSEKVEKKIGKIILKKLLKIIFNKHGKDKLMCDEIEAEMIEKEIGEYTIIYTARIYGRVPSGYDLTKVEIVDDLEEYKNKPGGRVKDYYLEKLKKEREEELKDGTLEN